MLNASKSTEGQSKDLKIPLHSRRNPNRPLNEMAPLPPINLIETRFPNQLVLTHLGQTNRPNQPVDSAAGDDGNADDAVQVVGQGLVDGDAVLGRDEGRDHEVDVTGEEEDHDGEGCAEGRVPVVLLAVRVEPDEAEGDEDVDDGEGVGDYAGGRCVSDFSICFRVADKGSSYLRMKLYASPGGGASMMITETSQCSNRPARGALNGRLLAKKRE